MQNWIRMEEAREAKELAKLDAQMRRARGKRRITAMVAFTVRVAQLKAASKLNYLAETYVPKSCPSERSLDAVFENGAESDAVVCELVRLAREDQEIAGFLADEFSAASIEAWKQFEAGQPAQAALF